MIVIIEASPVLYNVYADCTVQSCNEIGSEYHCSCMTRANVITTITKAIHSVAQERE